MVSGLSGKSQILVRDFPACSPRPVLSVARLYQCVTPVHLPQSRAEVSRAASPHSPLPTCPATSVIVLSRPAAPRPPPILRTILCFSI